ncbi:hypothetical protein ACF1BN_37605 [Streptomyces sp. NPDC014861]|uniref:hypothetical protein n=1 Tax=Streptomyces sp. NPDC014861 TaxID=3364923 RepID=UPI0036F5C46C
MFTFLKPIISSGEITAVAAIILVRGIDFAHMAHYPEKVDSITILRRYAVIILGTESSTAQ